jgi:hypothetical protein
MIGVATLLPPSAIQPNGRPLELTESYVKSRQSVSLERRGIWLLRPRAQAVLAEGSGRLTEPD